MKKFHIVLIIILGMFLMPSSAVACGKKSNKTEKSCCKKGSSKTEKTSCCDKGDKKCSGKCGHSSCTAASGVQFSLIPTSDIDFNNNNFNFPSEKQRFYHSETFLSSGFHSLWLIPKIS